MRIAFALALLFAPSLAPAASFNCSNANTPQEKAICASPELSRADDEMSAAYRRLLNSTPPEVAAEIRQDQRDWLTWLSAWCGYATRMAPQSWAECMLEPYKQRLSQLKNASFRIGDVTFVNRTVTRYRIGEPVEHGPDDLPDEWKNSFATLSAEWPEALINSPEWKGWNRGMENAARGIQSIEAPKGQVPPWQAVENVDCTITAKIQLLTSRLVVVFLDNFWDGHGAHPNDTSSQFNWLLQERRELKPEDVFLPGSGWKEFLYERCDRDLHQKLDDTVDGDYTKFSPPGEMAKTVRGIVADSNNWEIGREGIAIIYQDYAVACHACRPEPTRIPWDDLQRFLQPGFEIPR